MILDSEVSKIGKNTIHVVQMSWFGLDINVPWSEWFMYNLHLFLTLKVKIRAPARLNYSKDSSKLHMADSCVLKWQEAESENDSSLLFLIRSSSLSMSAPPQVLTALPKFSPLTVYTLRVRFST